MLVVLALVLSARAGEDVHAHMAEHLALAAASREAVVVGDFGKARAKLAELGAHEPLAGLGPAEERYVATLRAIATAGGKARTMEAVGAAVAQIALQCGACHAERGTGPDFGPIEPPPSGPGTKPHMQRHAWAQVRMWEGLVARDPQRWDAGALHLVEDPVVKPGSPEAHADPDLAALAARIHRAGSDALVTWTDDQRAELYGSLLATCARCHRASNDGSL